MVLRIPNIATCHQLTSNPTNQGSYSKMRLWITWYNHWITPVAYCVWEKLTCWISSQFLSWLGPTKNTISLTTHAKCVSVVQHLPKRVWTHAIWSIPVWRVNGVEWTVDNCNICTYILYTRVTLRMLAESSSKKPLSNLWTQSFLMLLHRYELYYIIREIFDGSTDFKEYSHSLFECQVMFLVMWWRSMSH